MYDSKYDSKMHDIAIPLMGFNGFHHASNNESKDDFDDFIGRESILDKLNSWLVDHEARKKKKYSGAYLISGFRGMGKSSFVYKAILDIKNHAKKHKFTTCHYIPISINVGNDLLTSKEMLYIICKLLSVTFDEKTRIAHNKRSQMNLYIAYLLLCLPLTIFLGRPLINNNITPFIKNAYEYVLGFISNIFNLSNQLTIGNTGIFSALISTLSLIALFALLCYLCRPLYYFLWKQTDFSFFITTWQIKRVFNRLNERIDSEITETTERDFSTQIRGSKKFGPHEFRAHKSKKNFYPIAQTAEIQDLLVNQLRLIKQLKFAMFRIIFIIDELDKVSPEDDEKQIIPEFEYINAVKGNSSYRSRQKALASLLSNMKYFISSSEAKFIFITGYDMYETTLADISNREFSIHSIFNGYINVSSFMRKTGKGRGADSMIEEYFTHLLLREKDSKREDLRDYALFCRSKWQDSGEKTAEENEFFEILLERRIIFLRHFLTYLFYMSNGSPKKLLVYLEKYVRSKKRIEEQCRMKYPGKFIDKSREISLGYQPYWDKCEWFLYFDERSIQKIEFISYLIYPMIKNLIAKSSIYSDKLLVSTSFMISNLYKFHKSGFSWRNLEYMPELLDINKTPELRDFIGGIMQFLNQTHIDDVAMNLYKFKFPQRLSEEITFFSKTSEEISYLFNFSHDELLSIKTLYIQQLEHYGKEKYEAPAIASLHHLMGDIYMLEENYEQAIFEFNEALTAISRQEKDASINPMNSEDSTNILFWIRVSLKLGLAFEKRKTFDTAYLTYENLAKQILELADNAMPLLPKNPQSSQGIINYLKSNTSFFTHIRIAYLAFLAKIAVTDKMDLKGIDDYDLLKISQEFDLLTNKLADEIKPVAIMDFYNKLGSILYYKNSKNSDKFIISLHKILDLTSAHDQFKFNSCTNEPVNASIASTPINTKRLLTPCTACQYFNKSIKVCMEVLDEKYRGKGSNNNVTRDYATTSKALFFLKLFHDKELSMIVQQQGKLFIQVMSNTLLGLANTLFGCAKIKNKDLTEYFNTLYQVCIDLDNGYHYTIGQIKEEWLSPYTKSILYYLAAADGYKILSDYKAAYNIYIQILDAVSLYSKFINLDDQKKPQKAAKTTLDFCQMITQKAIHCAYLHYDSISCAEVDTQKYEFGKRLIDYINLHSLIVFPEVEVAIDTYHRICLMGDEDEQDKILKKVLNSRQLSSYKLISNVTQNIKNLSLKVTVNEIILSRIIPQMAEAFNNLNLNFGQTYSWIAEYYTGDNEQFIDSLLKKWNWKLFKESQSIKEKKFCLLDYLLKDSLYCLNTITELLEPLYSTTLYNDSYIGEFYRKAFHWNHMLICIRELYGYAETKDKTSFINSVMHRYSAIIEPANNDDVLNNFIKTDLFLNSLKSWREYCPSHISSIESIYQKISPRSSNYLTSSYLTGSSIDRLNKAIEMHTSGKAYKEMMTTLYFLEDDLQNDSNYLHLATERFLINHGVIQERIDDLKRQTINNSKSTLIKIDNYVKP